ncbi:MAG: tRNA uridine-5-carboxymethylaminomethyl(34) synthesis GTPase MnmE, partial [Flavobacteriales bacterium]|nr:tRNA uridine-5-carboxymethylaminomethyl(34) synthesis GTPase MnmE [Flavobacteriales bacterium]
MKGKPDIICALSSPPGMGALAIIRLSGSGCMALLSAVFSKDISSKATHTAHHGWILSEEEKVDDVVVTLFHSPKSFTGEDTVEISCHGSTYVQQRIIELLLSRGARLAKPGEFSMRAYLNAKMDLSQAEAVADLIASESAASHRQALHQMRGGFSREIKSLRERLVHFASMIELELDFAEEDVEFANRPQLELLVTEILAMVNRLRESFSLGNAIKNGVPVAILGAPNSGKSTLLNTLLNEERAIVSEIPGTTRDTIEDYITLGGIRFRFIDTAGIRHTSDSIEKMGIERAFDQAKSASVILLLFDSIETNAAQLSDMLGQIKNQTGDEKRILLLANKIDVLRFDEVKFKSEFSGFKNLVLISAKNKLHIEELKNELLELVNATRIMSGETIVTNARHYEALTQSALSLNEVLTGLQNGLTGDLLAVDLRKTLFHLGEIIGEVNADDLLHNIFSKFCIG